MCHEWFPYEYSIGRVYRVNPRTHNSIPCYKRAQNHITVYLQNNSIGEVFAANLTTIGILFDISQQQHKTAFSISLYFIVRNKTELFYTKQSAYRWLVETYHCTIQYKHKGMHILYKSGHRSRLRRPVIKAQSRQKS